MEWIEIKIKVQAPIDKVWHCWVDEECITKWNFATPEWCCPSASNDLKVGGKFSYRMEAKDGSFGFDFFGIYDEIVEEKLIRYTMGDGRRCEISFSITEEGVVIKESFEAEDQNAAEMQRTGWLAILGNFKALVEKMN